MNAPLSVAIYWSVGKTWCVLKLPEMKVSAAGESEGAVDFQVAMLRHLERHAPDLPVPRIIASRAGKDLEWIGLRPELVVEIDFDHVSAGRIRHGAKLRRWREDKPASECTYAQLSL